MSTLETLEKLTHAWPQAEREELGRAFGIGWTALRYQGTGSMEGLEFLYPFLNDSDAHVRRAALKATATIFARTGAGSLDKLSYVTQNRDLAIRDRSALVVGKAMAGESLGAIKDALAPAYGHRNDFIRALGIHALGFAAEGRAWEKLLPVFGRRIADSKSLVAENAIFGLGLAFARSGSRGALDMLRPFVPTGEAGLAIASIGQGSGGEEYAAELLRRYLQAAARPVGESAWDVGFARRDGVWALSWLLRGKALQALREMRFVFEGRSSGRTPLGRTIPRKAAIWTVPGAFEGAGEDGADAAYQLIARDEHSAIRAGILGLGVAMRREGTDEHLSTLVPYLAHGNAAVRDAANIAVGLLFQAAGRKDVLDTLRASNAKDRHGPCICWPLGVGLVYQGTGDETVATHLLDLTGMGQRRLARHAAFGVGLVYQGTSSSRAAELLLPVLESSHMSFACEALKLVDFDEAALGACERPQSLADGAGAGLMFVQKHLSRTLTTTGYPGWRPWVL